jgi:hypothetical protein
MFRALAVIAAATTAAAAAHVAVGVWAIRSTMEHPASASAARPTD